DYTEDDRPEIPKIRRASRTPYQFPESITKDQERTQQREGARQQPPDTFMVARKRPSSVYTQPPPAHRTQRDLPKRTQRDRLVYLRASQPVIILCVLLFVVVIIGAIIANAVH